MFLLQINLIIFRLKDYHSIHFLKEVFAILHEQNFLFYLSFIIQNFNERYFLKFMYLGKLKKQYYFNYFIDCFLVTVIIVYYFNHFIDCFLVTIIIVQVLGENECNFLNFMKEIKKQQNKILILLFS